MQGRAVELVKRLLGWQRVVDGPQSAVDILRRTPYGDLDPTVRRLIQSHSSEEARQAMVELIKDAPLTDFRVLKRVYFKYFAN
jgi:hypothetical protein